MHTTPKKLVLIGGGHAHLLTLMHLRQLVERGVEVSVIQPSEYHYYSGMGPGMLGGTYHPDDIRFATRKIVKYQGAAFIRDRAVSIDPQRQVVHLEHSGQEIAYDVLSCNAGSNVPGEVIRGTNDTIFTAKPIERLIKAQEKIITLSRQRSITVVVAGGGPSSIEIAGNVEQLCRQRAAHTPQITIFAGREILAQQPGRVRRLARTLLEKKGIQIKEGNYVSNITPGRITLDNGRSFAADVIFPALGVKPSPVFARSGLSTGPDGGLLVNRCLQSVDHGNIFGGGDCICFQPRPLAKVGVYAVRENPVLLHNLRAALDGRSLQVFNPGGRYLSIYNLGSGQGIFCKWSFSFAGRLAFKIKDYIDRTFITTFQTLEKKIEQQQGTS